MTQQSQFEAAFDAVQRAALDAAETDSLALYHIKNVVLLAAFACEARRTLKSTSNALQYHAEARSSVEELVRAPNNWGEFENVAGDVLQHVASQIDGLSTVIGRRPFDVGRANGGVS